MTNLVTKSFPDMQAIAAISQVIYQSILQTIQHHPHLITSKYQATPWHIPQVGTAFVDKMVTDLGKFPTSIDLEQRIQQILKIFFTPQFLETTAFQNLQTKIQSLLSTTPTRDDLGSINLTKFNNSVARTDSLATDQLPIYSSSPNNGNGYNCANFNSINNNIHYNNQGITILLLDVENLQLDTATEKFLENVCHYPIQIKIAFANWRHMGKQDLEFHQRGYELVHVPAGKDSADVKLATVGSSIFIHYPTAKEVIVCSSDMVLTHLCTTLQTHGLVVYLVRKQGDNLITLDMKTGETYTRMLKIAPEISSINLLVAQLQQMIQTEQQTTGKIWIKLSSLSQLFRRKYHLTISQLVSTYLPGKKAREIFLENRQVFVVHQPQPKGELYITLFDRALESPPLTTPPVTSSAQNPTSLTTNIAVDHQELALTINNSHETNGNNGVKEMTDVTNKISFRSQKELETALVKIINQITQNDHTKAVYVGVLGNQFSRHYGSKVTTVIKSLKLASSFSGFLESSAVFKLTKDAQQNVVSLA
ncbi:MAG: NYN domain-containing protein [Coleofasciculaceae cyanobacterium SM2_1_6]|nr:NYN domain-containing protein [Coleofasciculaceae cyanobacterium SM2_1_6]